MSLHDPYVHTGGLVVSAVNSTTSPLGAAGVFNGTFEDIRIFANIHINIAGTPVGASGTLRFIFSPDGVNEDTPIDVAITGLTGVTPIPLVSILPYFRVRYTNGATIQTTFRLTVVYHTGYAGQLIRFPGQALSTSEPVTVVRALVEPAVGSSTIPVSDGGGSLTIDGTVAVTQPIAVTDNAGSITIDAPVATPVAARLSDGAAFLTTTSGRLAVDGSGVTQPVSGTVTSNIGTTNGLHLDATFTSRINTLGPKTSANSTPVVIASDQAVIPVSDNAGSLTVDAASWPLPTGAATLVEQQTQTTALQLIDNLPHAMNAAFSNAAAIGGQLDDTSTTAATEDNVAPVRITAQRAVHTNLRNVAGTEIATFGAPLRIDPTGTTAQPITDNAGSLTIDSTQLPAALVGGRLDENVGAWLGSTAPTIGQKTMANSLPVALASDQTSIPVASTGQASTARIGRIEYNAPTTGQLTGAAVSAAASGDNTLVAGVGGQTIRVWKLFIVFAADVNVLFKDGAGTSLTGLMSMKANGAVVLDFDAEPWFLTSSSNAFVLNLSSAVQSSGRVLYTQS